jgi:hypothetical protein
MTSFAIGEVEALVLKAYRGAGYSWGLAQEAGRAAGWLGERGLPAIDLFAELLQQIAKLPHEQLVPTGITPSHREATRPEDDVCWRGPEGVLCPVATGALISDLSAEFLRKHQRLTLASVSAPAILLPFVEALELPLTFRVKDIEFGSPDGATESVQRVLDIAQLASGTVEINHVPTALPVPWQGPVVRTSGTAASTALLQQLAHRTYVPATRESREAGAGAGLSDND